VRRVLAGVLVCGVIIAHVRLTNEIEKELGALFEKKKLGSKPLRTIRELVERLVAAQALSRATGAAIFEFRDVRNRVIQAISFITSATVKLVVLEASLIEFSIAGFHTRYACESMPQIS
jgi:hypothetical protein